MDSTYISIEHEIANNLIRYLGDAEGGCLSVVGQVVESARSYERMIRVGD